MTHQFRPASRRHCCHQFSGVDAVLSSNWESKSSIMFIKITICYKSPANFVGSWGRCGDNNNWPLLLNFSLSDNFLLKQDNVHTNTESVQCISIVYSICPYKYNQWLFRPVEKSNSLISNVGRGKIKLAAFDGPFPKNPPWAQKSPKNLLRKPSYSPFSHKFRCHGNGDRSGKNAISSIRWPIPENPPIGAKISRKSLTQAEL